MDQSYPRIRPIEVFPIEQDGERLLVVHDPTNLAVGQVVISGPALLILTLMDGRHSLEDIQAAFEQRFSAPLPRPDLDGMIQQLDAAHYLDSDAFARHYKSLVEGYRSAPARVCHTFRSGDGQANLAGEISEMLGNCDLALVGRGNRRLVGLVAPHLDFARGAPCYADAYALLAVSPPAERYVILGTNHFGRSPSVVATNKAFQSPLGTTRVDVDFLARLQDRLGFDLCAHEFDHQQEHSVELQVLCLQHLLGADRFEIVPILCHDPCQPTGTASYDGNGVDLRDFARSLGELIIADHKPTVIIAGADLSHVGRRFGDARELDTDFLAEVEKLDRQALETIQTGEPGRFLATLQGRDNSTRVCSAGCIYSLMAALPTARPELLRYHQAVDPDSGTCVSCSAIAFWDDI